MFVDGHLEHLDLFGGALPLGDILNQGDDAAIAAQFDQFGIEGQGPVDAIAGAHLELLLEQLPAGKQRLQDAAELLFVPPDPLVMGRVADDLGRRVAQNPAEAVICLDVAPGVEVCDGNTVWTGAEGFGEFFLTLLQLRQFTTADGQIGSQHHPTAEGQHDNHSHRPVQLVNAAADGPRKCDAVAMVVFDQILRRVNRGQEHRDQVMLKECGCGFTVAPENQILISQPLRAKCRISVRRLL